MRTRLLGLVGTAAALFAGCTVQRNYGPAGSDGFGVPVVAENTTGVVDGAPPEFSDDLIVGARDGHMSGVVGPAQVDHTPDRLAAYDDGWFISVESVAQLPERAVMLYASASNARDLFRPGTQQTFSLTDDADGPFVTLYGCTGPEIDVYDEYDAPADEVDVVVEEGADADEVVVLMTGRWTTWDGRGDERVNTATTRFTLLR